VSDRVQVLGAVSRFSLSAAIFSAPTAFLNWTGVRTSVGMAGYR
jgi:hypothetical protein